jgi:hypothetical protein
MKQIPWHVLNKHLLQSPKITQTERYSICLACEHFNQTTKQCSVCKCFMKLKVKLVESACPIGRW